MTTPDDSINYNYLPNDYVPGIGSNSGAPDQNAQTAPYITGYQNIDKLRSLLNIIIDEATRIIDAAESSLSSLNLKVDTDPRLAQAQAQEWPSSLGEPKDYISHIEYKALEPRQTRGSEYIRNTYEYYVRGQSGSNAIDVITAASVNKQEATEILNFLDKYMGDINDSSEYRILESMQDWATSAVKYTRFFGGLYTQTKTQPPQIPAAEVGSLSRDEAKQYQALFQIKINAVNNEIKQLVNELQKEHFTNTSLFYDHFLGPALHSRLNVMRPLENKIGSANQALSFAAQGADDRLSNNFVQLLADQVKRNETYDLRMQGLAVRVQSRDLLANFSKQLDQKVETPKPNPFIPVAHTEADVKGLQDYSNTVATEQAAANEFTSSHSLLDGREDPLSHPQYLLKAGDTITGNIDMDDLVKIDGMDPSLHRHRGHNVDGTEQIHGEDIIDLVTGAIDRNESVCTPQNLRLINSSAIVGANNVALINSQVSWECNPAMTFEIQTIPVSKTEIPPVVNTYCVTTLHSLEDEGIIASSSVASDYDYMSIATQTAVYEYNWKNSTFTLIAGIEGTIGDIDGDSITTALFDNIIDMTQDYFDGRLYIADRNKIKMTGKGISSGHVLPMDITTVYISRYPIKRLDTQPQHFLNTIYAVEGPLESGKDRIVKLSDIDGNDSAAGSFVSEEITALSNLPTNITDIAVTANGIIYVLLDNDSLVIYDSTADVYTTTSIVETGVRTKAVTVDQFGDAYITYATL